VTKSLELPIENMRLLFIYIVTLLRVYFDNIELVRSNTNSIFLKIKRKAKARRLFPQDQVDRQISCILRCLLKSVTEMSFAELNEIAAKRRDAFFLLQLRRHLGSHATERLTTPRRTHSNYHGERLNDKPHELVVLVGKKGVYTETSLGTWSMAPQTYTIPMGYPTQDQCLLEGNMGMDFNASRAGATVDGDFFASRIHRKGKDQVG